MSSDEPGPTMTRHENFRSRASSFEKSADVLFERYHCEGPIWLLDGVKELYFASLNFYALSENLRLPCIRARLANVLFAQYELSYDLKSLDDSIKHYEWALLRSSHPLYDRCVVQADLALALYHRFEATGRKEDGKKALQILSAAEKCDCNHTDGGTWVVVVLCRVRTRASISLIDDVPDQEFQRLITALRAMPREHLSQSRCLTSLLSESCLLVNLKATGSRQPYLEQGLKVTQIACQLCTEDAEVLWEATQRALSNIHYEIYAASPNRKTGSTWHKHGLKSLEIDNSIHNSSLASRNRYVKFDSLRHHTTALQARSHDLHDLHGMEQAIKAYQDLLLLCPPFFAGRPRLVNNLVYALGFYFFQCGRISVLDEVVRLQEENSNTLFQTRFLASNVAELMLVRAQITDDDTARRLISQAINICQQRFSDPYAVIINVEERAGLNTQLVIASRMQIRLGYQPFLDTASMLQLSRESLAKLSSYSISEKVGLILAQTDALMLQARTQQDSSILAMAEQLTQATLSQEWMKSSIFRIDIIAAAADIIVARSDLRGRDNDLLKKAWELYEETVTGTTGRSRERFRASIRWADHASKNNYSIVAFKAYAYAIDLLSDLVFLGEDVVVRIEALRQVSGLAASSVATALEIENFSAAVDFLEQTRGIIWLQSSQSRDPQLRDLPSALHDRFMNIAHELEAGNRMNWAHQRQRTEELDKVIAEIRCLPSFERFLLPPLLSQIKEGLQEESAYAIVVVPVDNYCDVVVIGGVQGHSRLRLRQFDVHRARELVGSLDKSCMAGRSSIINARRVIPMTFDSKVSSDRVSDILSELWTTIVQPILEHMNVQRAPSPDARPRVWWCPIGPLSSLPLHAAGIYSRTADDHISQYVVSSYTPTLTALHRLLTQKHRVESTRHGTAPSRLEVVLVAQSQDHIGQSPLPNTRVEVDRVHDLVPMSCTVKKSDAGGTSVNTALEVFATAHVAHLACHGHQDQTDPMNSGFDLQDGRLTLQSLMQLRTPDAQLAYLSSCESAGMDASRPDEGLNLVGAMIFVGFKSVIGTMWAMDDIDGPFMAERIYGRIFRGGCLDMSAVPYAVDDAIRELRESGVPASRWATYVHFGV